MDFPYYKQQWMTEAKMGQCSIACTMSILNYFWYTDFNKRDRREMMQIMKKGKYRFNQDEFLTEEETGYMLDLLGFDITVCYSVNEATWKDYIYDPSIEKYKNMLNPKYHHFIQGNSRVDQNQAWVQDGVRSDLTDTKVAKQIYESSSIKKKFGVDIITEIQKNQGEETLFLLWLDWYTLHNETPEEGEAGGHIVISTGIENEQIVIYDPGPPVQLGIKKSFDTIKESMSEMGEYCFLIIREREEL